MKKILRFLVFACADLFFFFVILFTALVSKKRDKKKLIGLGPEPLINNVYHKKALELYGYKAETFVTHVYFIIEDFDIRFDRIFTSKITKVLTPYLVFIYSLWKYELLYLYFNGSSLSLSGSNLFRLEPFFYRLADVKTFIMPYGGDVANMLFSKELKYKNALTKDYPGFRTQRRKVEKQVDRWTKKGSYILSGCDWVDYMYAWDKLYLAHFSIDLDKFKSFNQKNSTEVLKLLHAPNHRNIKGTKHIIKAVEELKADGYKLDLVLLEKVPNEQVLEAMAEVDIVIDQLIIGWYAMFALEGMALGKPVITYIREDLLDLYLEEGVLESRDEFAPVSATHETIKDTIVSFYKDRTKVTKYGEKSRAYVEKYHSVEAIGKIFDEVNKELLSK